MTGRTIRRRRRPAGGAIMDPARCRTDRGSSIAAPGRRRRCRAIPRRRRARLRVADESRGRAPAAESGALVGVRRGPRARGASPRPAGTAGSLPDVRRARRAALHRTVRRAAVTSAFAGRLTRRRGRSRVPVAIGEPATDDAGAEATVARGRRPSVSPLPGHEPDAVPGGPAAPPRPPSALTGRARAGPAGNPHGLARSRAGPSRSVDDRDRRLCPRHGVAAWRARGTWWPGPTIG